MFATELDVGPWVLLVGCGALGLVVGSFLTVVVSRVPAGESIVAPRSHCPRCGTFLLWRDNIPVASWLLLRGRCRTCHAGIAPSYLWLELATPVAFLLAGLRVGLEPSLPVVLTVLAALLATSAMEIDGVEVPSQVGTVALAVAAALLVASTTVTGDFAPLRGGVLGATSGAAIALLPWRLMGRRSLAIVALGALMGLALGCMGVVAAIECLGISLLGVLAIRSAATVATRGLGATDWSTPPGDSAPRRVS